MGRKTSLTSFHLGLNKTTSFLSVETFPEDLRLSILQDILFLTKLRVGWKPLPFLIKNRRFPHRKPFLYSPKYFYHSVKIIKFYNKIEIIISIWDVQTNKKANQIDIILNREAVLFGRKLKKHFRKPFFFIANSVYQNTVRNLEVKILFQKGSSWLKKLYKLDALKKKTDLERRHLAKVDYGYLKQKEFRFIIKHRQFGFLMQCFLYAVYQLNTNLLLKLFCKTLSKTKKKGNKGRIIMKHFVKMMRILPFFFNGEYIGLSIFLKGRLWLSFRKKALKLSFGRLRRTSFNKSFCESTGKVFTRYGVFGVKILMSKEVTN
jgi:hypothetical protein